LSASGEPKVFISYRREETAGHAGRLYDVMASRFGDSNVFMDVDIAPGVDFVNRITQAVDACHVLLVIIGPRWASITNGAATPRLAQPGDFVRLEVEEGLRRSHVAVIPILVGGARMPDESMLPAPLRALSRRNALELSDTRWRYDVDRLLGALDRLLAGTSAVTPRPGAMPAVRQPPPQPPPQTAQRGPPPPERRAPGGLGLALTTTLIAAGAGLAGRAIAGGLRHGSGAYPTDIQTSDRVSHILDPLIWNGITWAVVGAAVVGWLTVRMRGPGAALGRLGTGALVGALAGVFGTAVYAVHPVLLKPDAETSHTKHALLIIGVATTGAIVGALVGWAWRRRASMGLSTGLLAGALWEGALIATDNSNKYHHELKACIAAALVVGLTTVTQALVDASEESSPRELAGWRRP